MVKLKLSLGSLILFGLLLFGIFLRLHRISTESISLEEYACVANLNEDSVLSFISIQRTTYPYGGILFPILQFLWSKFVGSGIVSLRIFSLLFWIATYTLIIMFAYYHEKKSRLPNGVSLVVAIGLSFSPALIFLGQEARMYMCYIFLSWCAIISLYHFSIKPNSSVWGLIWTLSNICLLWTHHAGILVWCVGALITGIMFITTPSIRRNLLYFAGIHLVVALGWLAWLLTIPPQPSELHQYYLPPNMKNLLELPFAFNVVRYGGICPADPYLSFSFLPQQLGEILRVSHKSLNTVVIGFSYLSIIGLGIGFFRSKDKEERNLFIILNTFLLLPPLILFVIAQIGPPVFTSRYLVFVLPLHFFGLGVLVAYAKRIFQISFILAIFLLLLYQIGYMASGPWRMDWKGVGNSILKQASEKDLVLIRDPFWTKIFEVNCPNFTLPLSDMYTYDGILDVAKVYLSTFTDSKEPSPSIWVIVPDVYGEGEPTLLSHTEAQIFSTSIRLFHGEQRIWLYRLQLNSIPPIEEYSLLLTGLDFILKEVSKETPKKIDQFYRIHRYDHDRTQFHLVRTSLALSRIGNYYTAGKLLNLAWNRNPNRIIEDYKLLSEIDSSILTSYLDLGIATLFEGVKCFSEGDFGFTRKLFLDLCSLFPNDPLPYWFLANLSEKSGDKNEADEYWRKVFICSPILPLGWHILYEPAVITLDPHTLSLAEKREKELDIITENIEDQIRWFLK